MVLVDGHVHIYDCFGVAAVFDAAAANFAAAARALGSERSHDSVLCVVASAREHFLDRVRTRREGRVWRGRHGYWEAEPGCEPETLVVRRGATRLSLLAGRQLVTRERLEVLALGTVAPLDDDQPIEATLAAVREAGGAAVLPWGVGKWLGARGAVIDRLLADPRWSDVCLGDNGNRLQAGRDPGQFEAARRSGRSILPGSDPLPLPGEEARVGAYGFALDAELDSKRPAAALLALLKSRAAVRAFGRRMPLARFVSRQVALQLKNRLAASVA
jgi:hypothetical protein